METSRRFSKGSHRTQSGKHVAACCCNICVAHLRERSTVNRKVVGLSPITSAVGISSTDQLLVNPITRINNGLHVNLYNFRLNNGLHPKSELPAK